jgi:hypothetical protein
MGIKFSNLASTTLASGVSSSTTSISVTSATSFPTLGSGDYFYASIGIGSVSEVVKVTSISGTTFTAVRGQDSTTAISHSSGAEIALRVVAATLEDLRDATDNDTTYSAGTGVSLSGTTFSLTDTNSKLNLSGGTLTGNLNLGDNDKAVFGASDDLQIYHDGSNSFITDTGTGNLYVRASNELALTSAAGEAFFLGIADGSSYLYHNGSVKLNTTATGIDVTGSVTATGGNSGNWNTAYGWGNHASAGYLTSHQSLSGYATETYVGTQISNLVDSSPSTLNTLNELAAALGDDPNFATTVSTSIGTKLPLAGGTLTGGLSGTTGSFSGSVTADKLSSQKLTSGNGGLRIHSSGTKIFAITEANAVNSGAMDLGASDAKFKDLYLSGTISSGAITSTGLTVQSSTYNKISSYFSGTYTSGFKFSDMNGGIWYDAGTDDLTVSAGHANSQLILESGGSTSLTLASNNNATFAGTISSGAITAVGASGTSVVQNIRNPSTSWGQYALTRYGSEGANSRYMDFGYYRGASEATRGLVIKSQANATKFTFLDSGDFQIGTTTVIDASRNVITGSNFYFGATDSSLLAKDGANIRYLADGIHKFETYNGGWGERVRIDDAGLDVTGTISSGAISIDNGSQRVKYGVWSGTTYGVGMGTGYTYGAINNDYVMSFQMNDDSDRGFWWGDTGHGNDQGAMALSTDGYLTVASGLRLGFGESDTTHPSAGLQVNGTISSGAITAPSIRSSSGEFHVNRSSDGASAIRVDADGVVVIPSNYFYVPASQGSYFSSAVRFRGMISNDTGTDVTIGDTLNVTLGIKLNGTTVIDASRNLTNVNLVKFRESGGSFYISPTNANTLNAQHGSNADTADMWINYRGYNDTFSNFRDFRIGDGKGSCLLFVDGSSKAFDFQSGSFLQISGTTVIDASRNITAGTVAGTTADFSGKVEFQGTAAIEGGTSNSGYGLFKGYSANYNHFLLSRGSVTGSTSSPSFSGNHQMTFVEYVANAADGFRFKSSNTGTYQEIAYINRVGISTIGTVTATGGNSTNWNTAYGWGNHASGGYAAASALSSKVHTSGNTGLGATWKTTFYSGGGGATFGANHYSMGKDVANGAWSSPNYSDLIIGYHTGIRIGAAYGGIRFYANSPTSDTNNTGHGNGGEQLLMTVGGTATTGGVYVNNDLYAGASVRTPIFYDNNNTQYYVDPTSASVSARFDGPIHFNRSAGSSYDFSVKVGAYNHPTAGYTSTTNKHWVGLEAKGGTHIILNTDGGDSATENAMDHFTVWQGGIDTVAKKKFWVTNIGNSYSKISSRAPIFYDSNNTAYYVDPHSTGTSFKGQGLTDSKAGFKSTANPWNTSDSAFFPNGITTNNTTNWIYGTCFLGNAPSNGNGNEAKAAGTIESTSWHKASLYYDRNNTAYYVDPSSTGTSLNVAGKIIASGGVQVGQSSVGYNLADTFTYDGIATQQYGVTFKPSKVIMSGYQGLGLFTNSTERLSIASNGNVTAVADLRTPVVYDSNNTAYYVNPASTSNNGSRMRGGMLFGPNTSWNEYLYVGGNGRDGSYASVASTNGNLHLDGKAGFNVYLSWYTTSDVQCGAGLVAQGNITAYSDAKLKKDVVTIDAALDKVNALRGVYYVRKDQEDGRRCIGVIAQEVQDVLPELVHSNTGPDNTEETLSVDYGKMVGVLVEAIKELKSEVDDLKTQLSQKEK